MIEGNFKDVSLPGLLQFLGAEVSKNYRISVANQGQNGEVYLCRGFVVAGSFGLLEGEDAICEFLSWEQGTFFIETLTPQVEVKKNLKRAMQANNVFVENTSYLLDNNVGLNTTIVSSKNFGTVEWQESLRQHPLEREDFVVLGWLGDGRTMRQALREFSFDLPQACAILTRLLKTNSVQCLRPSASDLVDPTQPAPADDPVVQRFVTTGGQEAAAASVAQAAAMQFASEATAAVAQDAFISTSFRPGTVPVEPQRKDQKGPGNNPILNPIKKIGVDLAAVRASMEARLRSRNTRRMPDTTSYADPPEPGQAQGIQPVPSNGSSAPPSARSAPHAEGVPLDKPIEPQIAATPPNLVPEQSPAPLPAAPLPMDPPVAPAASFSSDQPDQPDSKPPQSALAKLLADANGAQKKTFASETEEACEAIQTDQYLPVVGQAQESHTEQELSSASPAEKKDAQSESKPSEANNRPAVEQPKTKRSRTESLPLVTIDIERLLNATFTPTQFGKLALTNPALDQYRRQTLLDVEAGRSLMSVMSEGSRAPAALLNSYRYCLDRGYIETADSVVPITADLLLGRMEIDQYLLQRRRITGDQLRDLVALARNEGIKLTHALVRSGYLTQDDLDNLEREQIRFAFK